MRERLNWGGEYGMGDEKWMTIGVFEVYRMQWLIGNFMTLFLAHCIGSNNPSRSPFKFHAFLVFCLFFSSPFDLSYPNSQHYITPRIFPQSTPDSPLPQTFYPHVGKPTFFPKAIRLSGLSLLELVCACCWSWFWLMRHDWNDTNDL